MITFAVVVLGTLAGACILVFVRHPDFNTTANQLGTLAAAAALVSTFIALFISVVALANSLHRPWLVMEPPNPLSVLGQAEKAANDINLSTLNVNCAVANVGKATARDIAIRITLKGFFARGGLNSPGWRRISGDDPGHYQNFSWQGGVAHPKFGTIAVPVLALDELWCPKAHGRLTIEWSVVANDFGPETGTWDVNLQLVVPAPAIPM
jgi:hypothetical protein